MASKLRYLNVKLSEYLNDKVPSYDVDGLVYSSVKRDEYLNKAFNYIFRLVWNLSNYLNPTQNLKFEFFSKTLPDLVKRVIKTTSSSQPAKFILDSTTSDLFQIISIMRNSDKKILTQIPVDKSLIAESEFNTLYKFNSDYPAYFIIQNEIFFLPSNMINTHFTMLYIKAPVQDNGQLYSCRGQFDIPFKPEFYEIILLVAKSFALYDSHEIEYGQLLMQLSSIELQLMKGGT